MNNTLLKLFFVVFFVGIQEINGALPSKCSAAGACSSRITLVEDACDPQQLIAQHEGCCLCAYVDTKGHPTIGIGFNLDASAAKQQIQNLGLNFTKVYSGAQCLNNSAVDTLFQYSLKIATQQAMKDVPTFDQLCCNVQNVIIDMEFNMGSIGAFTTFLDYINTEQWDMAAKDLKYATLWCGQVGHRCTDDMDLIEKGCPCFGGYPAACSGPACCTTANMCCDTLRTNWSNAEVTRCCPAGYPTCCGNNPTTPGCCGQGYSTCCSNLKSTCCADGHPVCCGQPFPDGWCCMEGTACGGSYGTCALELGGAEIQGVPNGGGFSFW